MKNEALIKLLKDKGLTDEQINNLLSNKAYWDKRFEQLQIAQINMAANYYATLDEQFNKACANIQADIEKWYMRFANNEGITLAEARRRLNSKELEEFRWTVEEYIEKGKTLKYSDEWASALENASVRVHISRLEALKIQLQQQVEVLFNNQSDGLETLLTSIYEYGFYHTCYEIEKGIGLGTNINAINPRKLKAIISNPWASDGSNFSQRIWGKYRPQLVQTLHTEMTQACIRGDNPEKIINTISKKFNVSKKQAGNLVMTEQAYFSSIATKGGYQEIGVEKYKILATLDLHTSEICRSLDGKPFNMSEYEPWVTAPPFHNRCRSTTTPYFDDDIGERIARGADGKQYMVPANMTYKEWYDKYVKEDVTAELKEKELNNEYADRKQYENYKRILGKEVPKTFYDFQELKYGNPKAWDELKIKKSLGSQLSRLTDEEKEVLTRYTGNLANNINSALGTGNITAIKKHVNEIRLLDSALAKGVIPEDITVIRKTIVSNMNLPEGFELSSKTMKDLKNYETFNDIFTSTALKDFDYPGRDVFINLKVPKGYKGALYIKPLAHEKYKYQEELLFHRGLNYRITRVSMKEGIYYMEAEVI